MQSRSLIVPSFRLLGVFCRPSHIAAGRSWQGRMMCPAAVPAPQYLNSVAWVVNPVKHFEMVADDEPSHSWSLPHARVTFGKKAQALRCSNNPLAQVSSRVGILPRDLADDSLQVLDKERLEGYFEVHALSRARTSSAVQPRSSPAALALPRAASKAAKTAGSSSLHWLTSGARPSFSRKALQDLRARFRSSSGRRFPNSASISARLISLVI